MDPDMKSVLKFIACIILLQQTKLPFYAIMSLLKWSNNMHVNILPLLELAVIFPFPLTGSKHDEKKTLKKHVITSKTNQMIPFQNNTKRFKYECFVRKTDLWLCKKYASKFIDSIWLNI